MVWTAKALDGARGPVARANLHLAATGEEGYPGTVKAVVVYTLTQDDEFRVDMVANTDRTTLVNLVQHTYWNIGGIGSGTVEGHELTLHASQYTPGDPVVPTGVVAPVRGTPFDFEQKKTIGQDLSKTGGNPVGYDHNWIVDGDPHQLRPVAELRDPVSGRSMILSADQPEYRCIRGTISTARSAAKE